ncbi:DUF5701 family protein [Marinactinospora thermotolerans]|uniref:Uncharacterized protein n=1 Tax=Marinactinospora thermotolerans DSM 45154 TaxID=1122192 RepID=A0A1T4PUA2_9ACTN|nr:DUF5701 family protein [Marinactinospora thermotolerans]SJZ94807.1 hypothetical protein SAMN02745673_01990 [Marinactinospora thermotolerans DSM 45154]
MQERPPSEFDAGAEFDRQVDTLIAKGYPEAAGLDTEAFTALLAPLRATAVAHGASLRPPAPGRAPFVVVLTRALAPIEWAMSRTTLARGSKAGFVDRLYEPGAIERFVPTDATRPPDERAYLLFDVERGEEFCGAVPEDAMATIAQRGRSTLTIEEGIALVTHHPDALEKNRCFSLAGSRCGDRRVPAIWISQRAPKLGWCWAGNPHTWLGMASAARRAAA